MSRSDDSGGSPAVRRRSLIAAVGAAAATLPFAGCAAPTKASAGGSASDETFVESFAAASNPWEEYDLDTSGKGLLLEGVVTLDPGEYVAESYLINLDFYIDYTIEMRSGGTLDFLFLPANQFEEYRAGSRTSFFWQDSLSGPDDSGHGGPVGAIDSGDYVVVFDNTDRGDGEPTEPVRAEVRFLTHHCLTGKTAI